MTPQQIKQAVDSCLAKLIADAKQVQADISPNVQRLAAIAASAKSVADSQTDKAVAGDVMKFAASMDVLAQVLSGFSDTVGKQV